MNKLLGDYDIQQSEAKWRRYWGEKGVYDYDPSESRDGTFSIDTPPPTVSGLLHMGHIFSYTQTDFIARYQRMKGMNVFYPIGFDDNGLATERLVEKVKGIRAGRMEREEFIRICQEVVQDSERDFRELFEEIALSVDWKLEYQTISAKSRKLSQMSFIDLLNKGLAYRKFSPTFWDAVDRTAIAQAEIEDKERKGVMYDIAFSSASSERLVIATTRPELLCACVALLYNPNDERYKGLDRKNAIVPIFGQSVPIISDEAVDPKKGTGLVMCCTFGDIQDIEWWRKHNLATVECITLEGKMVNARQYDGMSITAARLKLVEDLQSSGLLMGQREVIQFVKCAERSGAALEIIPTHQWYIKLLDHKEKFLEKGRECNWHPDYMRVRLENWINGLNQDWCISRQRFFGVPIPVWYSKRAGEEGKVLLPELNQLPVDPLQDLPHGYERHEVEAEADVMDTWATSSISPQLNTSAISKSLCMDYDLHTRLYPFDLRPQAHEIIRTWGFYTIVKSLFHEESIPWKNLMISGWCLASDKTKMSKSKGNVVTPKELILEKGADVVRYWASTSKLGVDTAYSEELFKIGKKLITKLWNSAKFVSMHFSDSAITPTTPKLDVESGVICESLDLWILSCLARTIDAATVEFERFEYSDARTAVEGFFWNDFCDRYLELVKMRVYDEQQQNAKGRVSAINTLYHCLQHILLLFAPFIPHVTEEINAMVFGGKSIHCKGSWPKSADQYYNKQEIEQGVAAVKVLDLIRKFKSERNISIKAPLKIVRWSGPAFDDSLSSDLKSAANAHEFIRQDLLLNPILTSQDQQHSIYIELIDESSK